MDMDKEIKAKMKTIFGALARAQKADSIVQAKCSALSAALQSPSDPKEVEKCRQECVDAFSAFLDVEIEGCKLVDGYEASLGAKLNGN